ncbi:MAG: hypothetical protein ACTHMG_14425 [Sphingomonas sp.]
MSDTSTATGVTGAITTAHLTLIVILAILAILAIWWGGRARRARRRAEHEVEHRQSDFAAGQTAAETVATPHERALVDTPPTRPAPPPIVETPAPAAPPPPAAVQETDAAPPVAEPVAAPAPTQPAVAAVAEPAAPSAPADGGDADRPVTLLKGLGPKVSARLAEQGITTVGQLAALTPAEAEALDAELGTFRGRMTRDRWLEQARLLAAGDRAGYEATFGKLG